MKRHVIQLTSPAEFGGVRYTTLTIRPPRRKDFARLAARSELHGEHLGARLALGVALTARLCGVPEGAIFALSEGDAERLGNHVMALIADSGFGG